MLFLTITAKNHPQGKLDALLSDKEKWERLSKSRDLKIKELNKQIRKLEVMLESREEGDDVVSEAGFSDVSETLQNSIENALDIVINSAKMDFRIVQAHFFPAIARSDQIAAGFAKAGCPRK